MPKIQFKYKDEYEKISMKHSTDKKMTTIEWYIVSFCQFLVALGFSKKTIQSYIPYDGEIYTIDDWVESLIEDDRLYK